MQTTDTIEQTRDLSALDTVSQLNSDIFESGMEDSSPLEYISDGFFEGIKFMGIDIWNSNEDEREYLPESARDESWGEGEAPLESLTAFIARTIESISRDIDRILAVIKP